MEFCHRLSFFQREPTGRSGFNESGWVGSFVIVVAKEKEDIKASNAKTYLCVATPADSLYQRIALFLPTTTHL